MEENKRNVKQDEGNVNEALVGLNNVSKGVLQGLMGQKPHKSLGAA